MALTHFYLNQVPCREDYFKKKTLIQKLSGAVSACRVHCRVSDFIFLIIINSNIVGILGIIKL